MSNSNSVDWNSIGSQEKKSGGGNSNLVFLSSKNLPITLLPNMSKLAVYESVFEGGKNRPPQPGEKGKKSYVFYGLVVENEKKVVKIFNCGTTVIQEIKKIQDIAKDMANALTFVEVSSKGSGMQTEYSVKQVKLSDKNIPTDIWETKLASQLQELDTLQVIADRLSGRSKKEEPTSSGSATPGKSLDW